MNKVAWIALTMLAFLSSLSLADIVEKTKQQLPQSYRHFQYDKIEASQIPGIAAIYSGDQIIYYAPDQDVLIFGELYGKDGKSITQLKLQQHRRKQAAAIDTDAALTIGDGDLEMLVFTNPDCGYCRRLVDWMKQQDLSHVKQHWFYMIPKDNPLTSAKALRALCSKENRELSIWESHSEMIPGKELTECRGGRERLARHQAVAAKAGAFATPYVVVNGEVVAGFQPERLTTLLKLVNRELP